MGQRVGAFAWALAALFVVTTWSLAEEPGVSSPGDPIQPTADRNNRFTVEELAPAELKEAERRIDAALDQPLKSPLDYAETPLNQIAAVIAEEYNIPIVFDTVALDSIACSPEAKVTVSLRNVTLRSALELIFRQVEDATYMIDHEVLMITTTDESSQQLVAEVYRVDDLLALSPLGETEFDALIDIILGSVDHDSWMENGTGEGEMLPYAPGMLVITQTPPIHKQVKQLLAAMRQVKAEVEAAAGPDASVAAKPVTRGFLLREEVGDSEESRAALRDAIQASVEWDARGELAEEEVFLHVLPKRLLVRHVPQVVRQVEEVLRNLNAADLPAVGYAANSGRGSGGGQAGEPSAAGRGESGRRGGGF